MEVTLSECVPESREADGAKMSDWIKLLVPIQSKMYAKINAWEKCEWYCVQTDGESYITCMIL